MSPRSTVTRQSRRGQSVQKRCRLRSRSTLSRQTTSTPSIRVVSPSAGRQESLLRPFALCRHDRKRIPTEKQTVLRHRTGRWMPGCRILTTERPNDLQRDQRVPAATQSRARNPDVDLVMRFASAKIRLHPPSWPQKSNVAQSKALAAAIVNSDACQSRLRLRFSLIPEQRRQNAS